MFDYFNMMGNYEQRKVENTIINGTVIDTCRVTDSSQPYETGIQNPLYHDGDWVIVEMYSTEEAARKGHAKWVKKFSNKLPESLVDVGTSTIAQLLEAVKPDINKEYKRKDND
jgi:hypothetical protein